MTDIFAPHAEGGAEDFFDENGSALSPGISEDGFTRSTVTYVR